MLSENILSELGVQKIDGKYRGLKLSSGIFYDYDNTAVMYFTKAGICDPIQLPWHGTVTVINGECELFDCALLPSTDKHKWSPVVMFRDNFFRLNFDDRAGIQIGLNSVGRFTSLRDGWMVFRATKGTILKFDKQHGHEGRTEYLRGILNVGSNDDGTDPDPMPEDMEKVSSDMQNKIRLNQQLRNKFK